MGLPEIPIPTEKVETPGGPVLVRGLSAKEAEKANKIWESGDKFTFQAQVIAYGTDTEKADVVAWLDTVPAGIANDLVLAIHRLSGLDEEASKSVEGGSADG